MTVEHSPEFAKDVKALKKRFITISDDLVQLEKILKLKPKPSPPFSFHISGLGVSSVVVKVKKIACRALKGKGVNSGLRLVYALFEDQNKIVLIELYHKSDKELEDRERIERILGMIE
jgi:mRNA-degrading endonuclease RelE of RelBE toxin-antitoxin system